MDRDIIEIYYVSNIRNNIKEIIMITAIVWSKSGCQYCDMAKALLYANEIAYEERNIETDWTKEQLLEAVPSARSLPQIFLNGEFIGGFKELQAKLSKE